MTTSGIPDAIYAKMVLHYIGSAKSFVKNSQRCYRPGPFLTVDEQLFPTKTRCKWTQYISNKPDKFGIKIFLKKPSSTSTQQSPAQCARTVVNYHHQNSCSSINQFSSRFVDKIPGKAAQSRPYPVYTTSKSQRSTGKKKEARHSAILQLLEI